MKPNNDIALANDQSAFFPAYKDGMSGGTVAAANDANFDAAHLSEPLTDYILDYPDEDGLAALLDAAAPMIPSGRSFTYRTHDDAEAFQIALSDEDIREIGGEFSRVRRTGSQADGRTDNKGLIMVLDNDQGGEDPAVQQRAVANLRSRLLRTELRRLVMLLDANDTAAPSENWGPTNAGADPDGSIINQIDLSGDARGLDPSVVLFGGGAYIKRKRAMSVRDKAGSFAGLMMTADDLAAYYGVQKVLTSKFRYQSATATKSKVIADQVWIYDARPGLMGEDPSNIKRFVTLPGGQQFRVYVEARLKQTLVAVEHYSRIICTSALGIRQLPVTYS